MALLFMIGRAAADADSSIVFAEERLWAIIFILSFDDEDNCSSIVRISSWSSLILCDWGGNLFTASFNDSVISFISWYSLIVNVWLEHCCI
jgi:hypothetical protein